MTSICSSNILAIRVGKFKTVGHILYIFKLRELLNVWKKIIERIFSLS